MMVDQQPAILDFSVSTLDRPEAIAPAFPIFWGSKISWFEPKDELPRHEKFRPEPQALDPIERS